MKIISNTILKGFSEGAEVKTNREAHGMGCGAIGIIISTRPCTSSFGNCPDNWSEKVRCPGYMSISFNDIITNSCCWGYYDGFSLDISK